MRDTTLCYIRDGQGRTLLLHRIKKKNDLNHDKWIGVGGKFEEGESPTDCLLREVREETGLTLTRYALRGIVTFVSSVWESEQMYLFTADGFTGEPIAGDACAEGELCWVDDRTLDALPTWEGDRIFLRLLREGAPFFLLKLVYGRAPGAPDGADEVLLSAVLDGRALPSTDPLRR